MRVHMLAHLEFSETSCSESTVHLTTSVCASFGICTTMLYMLYKGNLFLFCTIVTSNGKLEEMLNCISTVIEDSCQFENCECVT